MINIADVAAKLDAEEKLLLTYKVLVESMGGNPEYEVREAELLDVSEEAKVFYVKEADAVVWVKLDEAISVKTAG